MAWRFTGDNFLNFNTSLLRVIADYDRLAKSGHASSAALQEKEVAIQRQLGMLDRIPQSPEGVAGTRLEEPLRDIIYPDARVSTHEYGLHIPPVRIGEGILFTGISDVIISDRQGHVQKVDEIKTAYWNRKISLQDFAMAQGPHTLHNRIAEYAQDYQNAYATALRLPFIDYRGFGFRDVTAEAGDYVGRVTSSGRAPSLKIMGQWGRDAVDVLERLGPQYIRALEKKTRSTFIKQVYEPTQFWAQRGIHPVGMDLASQNEKDAFYRRVPLLGYGRTQDRERVLDGDTVVRHISGKAKGATAKDIEDLVKEATQTTAIDPSILQTYVPGDASTNTGFSVEERLADSSKLRLIDTEGPKKERGYIPAGQVFNPLFSPDKLGWRRYISAMEKGHDDEARRIGAFLSQPKEKQSWSDYFGLAQYENYLKEGKRYDRRQHRAITGALAAGDEYAADLYTQATSDSDLDYARIEAAKHRREVRKQMRFDNRKRKGMQGRYKKGDDKGAWLIHGATTEEELDIIEIDAAEYDKKERERGRFERTRERAVLRERVRGNDEGAEILEATGSFDELKDAIVDVTMASRKATEAEKARNKALSIMGQIQPYDWTRWYKARSEAWGSIQQATSWLPNFITEPAGRIGDAAMQIYGARVARHKGAYDAFMEGIVPVGTAIGAKIGNIPGAAIGAGITGGISALSQIIGNIGEGRIKATGLEISSVANMWGGVANIVGTVIGTSFKALLFPLELFGRSLKIVVPSLIGFGAALTGVMVGGFKSMNALGNPLSALTGGSSFADYQRSLLMDTMSGLGEGTTQGSIQQLASMRQGFFGMGRFNQEQLVNAAMLGQFNMFYNNNVGNGHTDYNNMITRLSRQFYGQNASQRARSMYFLQGIDSTIATHVQTLMNQYAASGSTEMDWGKFNDPRTYNIPTRFFSDSERERFRVENFSFQTMKSSIEIDTIRIASSLWNKFGEGILSWVSELYRLIGSGASLKEVVGYIGTGLKDVWDIVVRPTLVDGAKSFAEMLKQGITGLSQIAPSLVSILKPAFLMLADTAFSIFLTLGESIWDAFKVIIGNFSTIRIDPVNFIKAMSNQGSWADAIQTTSSISSQIKDTLDKNRMETFYGKRRMQDPGVSPLGFVYEDSEGKKETIFYLAGGGFRRGLSQMKGPAVEAVEAVETWRKSIPTSLFQNSAGLSDRIKEITRDAGRRALIGGWGPFTLLTGLSAYLRNSELSPFANNLDAFIVEGGFDVGRNLARNLTGGLNKEELRKKFTENVGGIIGNINVAELSEGVSKALHSIVDLYIRLIDGEGRVQVERLVTALGDGTTKIVEETVNVLEDLSRKMQNVSELQINRAEQRLLAARSTGALR